MGDTVPVANSDREAQYYCLNCEEVLTGQYCAACGQKDIGTRLNSRLMIHNLFESLTDLNSKPWRTLIELVKNPGKVALAYINGARSSYINPIRFMITTFAIFVGFLAANGWLEVSPMESVNIGSTVPDDPDRAAVIEIVRTYIEEIKEIVTHQRDLLTFVFIPIFSFVLRWIFFRSGRNFAETLTLTCYLVGQVQLYSFFAALVPFFTSLEYTGTPDFILFIVSWQSIAGFYQKKWFKTFLMTVLVYLLFSVVNGIAAIVLAALHLQFS